MNYEDMGKKEKHKGGAPIKLTRDIINKICLQLKNGSYVETAAVMCGVPKSTFYNWINKAHEPNSAVIYKELLDATERAQAEADMRDLAIIQKAGEGGQWKASAWRLERRHPEQWGARQFIEQNLNSPSVILSEAEIDKQLHILQQVLDNTQKDKDCECDS